MRVEVKAEAEVEAERDKRKKKLEENRKKSPFRCPKRKQFNL